MILQIHFQELLGKLEFSKTYLYRTVQTSLQSMARNFPTKRFAGFHISERKPPPHWILFMPVNTTYKTEQQKV